MNNKKRLVIIISVCILLLSTLLCGCGKKPVRITPTETENYDISVFFGGSEDSLEIVEMINEFNKESGISVEAIVTDDESTDERYLKRLMDSDAPPVGFISKQNEFLDSLREEGVILSLSEADLGFSDEGVPFLINGYGLAMDKRFAKDISGSSDTDTFIADLTAANYYDWSIFLIGLNSYIGQNNPSAYQLNGNDYYFPEEKGEMISQVNGVFAIPGFDYSSIGDKLINVAFANVDLEQNDSDELYMLNVTSGLDTYYELLNTMTSMLAGSFAPGIRGSDFINELKYSSSQTLEMFSNGNAIFTIASNNDYNKISSFDAEKADNLVLIPIKIPVNGSGDVETENGNLVNNSIPITSSYFLYANSEVDSKEQEMFFEFLTWLETYKAENYNSIQKSLITYWEKGDVLPYRLANADLAYFVDVMKKDRVLDEFLVVNNWNSELKGVIIQVLAIFWT